MKPIYASRADAKMARFFSRRHEDTSFMRAANEAYKNRTSSRLAQVWDETEPGSGKFVSRKVLRVLKEEEAS